MSILIGGGKLGNRRPSYKGRLMYDVVNGSERVRAWPKKRGKPKSEVTVAQNNWFTQAQWASKYWPAPTMAYIMQAVSGTALLPRDITTMLMAGRVFMLTQVNGQRYYSMAMVMDVSDSLDVISQQPGTILYRGGRRWEALALPQINGYWQQLFDPAEQVTAVSTSAYQAKGSLLRPDRDILITSVRIQLSGQQVADYKAVCAYLNDDDTIAAIEWSSSIGSSQQGTFEIEIQCSFPVGSGQRVALMIADITSDINYGLHTTSVGVGYPMSVFPYIGWARARRDQLIIGGTVDVATPTDSPFRLSFQYMDN